VQWKLVWPEDSPVDVPGQCDKGCLEELPSSRLIATWRISSIPVRISINVRAASEEVALKRNTSVSVWPTLGDLKLGRWRRGIEQPWQLHPFISERLLSTLGWPVVFYS